MPGYVYRGKQPFMPNAETQSGEGAQTVDVLLESPLTPERLKRSLSNPKYRNKANEGFKCGSALGAVMHAIKGERLDRNCFRALRRQMEGRSTVTGEPLRNLADELTPLQRKTYGL